MFCLRLQCKLHFVCLHQSNAAVFKIVTAVHDNNTWFFINKNNSNVWVINNAFLVLIGIITSCVNVFRKEYCKEYSLEYSHLQSSRFSVTLSGSDSKFAARFFLICLFLSMRLYSNLSLNCFVSSAVSSIYDKFFKVLNN